MEEEKEQQHEEEEEEQEGRRNKDKGEKDKSNNLTLGPKQSQGNANKNAWTHARPRGTHETRGTHARPRGTHETKGHTLSCSFLEWVLHTARMQSSCLHSWQQEVSTIVSVQTPIAVVAMRTTSTKKILTNASSPIQGSIWQSAVRSKCSEQRSGLGLLWPLLPAVDTNKDKFGRAC